MKISFLASHGGSAAKHIITAIREKCLDAQIGIVITNNKNSDIYHWCVDNAVEVVYLSGNTHPIEEEKDRVIHQKLLAAGTDLIVLSGYMKKIGSVTLAEYANKILNIHPSLLPRHGGKGLYGDRVHESVLKAGDEQSGATVHFINEEYDEGPIVAQKKINVVDGETVVSLKTKVQAIECELYLNSIKQIMQQLD
jgi:phosphoribosylglycinamide formyltransferase-1